MRRSVRLLAVALVWLAAAISAGTGAAANKVRVIDGDTIAIGEVHYRLHGIDAPEAGQTCKSASGKAWRCGDAATKALADLLQGNTPNCDNRGVDEYDRIISVCSVGDVELNAEMISRGLAWAFRRYSLDYVDVEDAARLAGVGIWQSATETAWEYRERRWAFAAQAAPAGCPIKGNISEGGRIYHAPWSPWYEKTRVSLARGERWFCSEREALDAGWRAPVWGR